MATRLSPQPSLGGVVALQLFDARQVDPGLNDIAP